MKASSFSLSWDNRNPRSYGKSPGKHREPNAGGLQKSAGGYHSDASDEQGVKRTHQCVRVLEEKQPLEAVPLKRLGHPLPQKKVVNVAVPVRLGLQRERVFLGQDEARRTVAQSGHLRTPTAVKIMRGVSSGDRTARVGKRSKQERRWTRLARRLFGRLAFLKETAKLICAYISVPKHMSGTCVSCNGAPSMPARFHRGQAAERPSDILCFSSAVAGLFISSYRH